MEFITLKKVTIISDNALENHLIEDLKICGAKGYTTEDAKGFGEHNVRDNEIEGLNIKIECIVDEFVSDKIFLMLQEKYFDKLSIIAYLSDVKVIRRNKFN